MTEAEYEAFAEKHAKCEMFNVGDEVTIDNDLKTTHVGIIVVPEMLWYRGKTSVIAEKRQDISGKYFYKLRDFPWSWQDFMLMPSSVAEANAKDVLGLL